MEHGTLGRQVRDSIRNGAWDVRATGEGQV